MAVVIRLQGLPIVAGTMDIRHFFSGLTIPDGGVHIVGGDHGEAFIVFGTDEDARLGMMRTGGAIKGSKVSLLLSSKTEMQNMIELSRRRFEAPPETPPTAARPTTTAPPSAVPSAPSRSAHGASEQRARSRSPHRHGDLCVYLKGLPYEADKAQVKDFFKNLALDEDSLYIAYGANGKATGEGFVEFKSEADHKAALAAHMQYMGARFIQVHPISRKGMMEKIEQIRKRDGDAPDSAHRTPRNCLHITNIPYNVSRKDVRAFLDGLAVYEDSLSLTSTHDVTGLFITSDLTISLLGVCR
uniref:RRM domain-containing protein n=1 Tax=Neogobius melanostomus TaxID=47308 RepID=A0A8C6SZ92_9GOBI